MIFLAFHIVASRNPYVHRSCEASPGEKGLCILMS